jgi:hypothetical protein
MHAATGRCAVCHQQEPFGLNLCAQCGGTSERTDSLVFVRRPATRAERVDRRERLLTLLGAPAETPAGVRAARGERALLRLPAALAPRVVDSLDTNGIPALVLPVARAWLAMPSHFFLMLGAILLFGGLAGWNVLPTMRWTSPIMAALLLVAAQLATRQPLLGTAQHAPRLPGPAAVAVRSTFAALGPGAARDSLGDIVRLAQPIFSGSPRALGSLISDLVSAACATALQVSRLETIVQVLRERESAGQIDSAGLTITRCEQANETGLDLMNRAIAALGSLAASHETNHEPLAELTRALELEAETQAQAARDANRLIDA